MSRVRIRSLTDALKSKYFMNMFLMPTSSMESWLLLLLLLALLAAERTPGSEVAAIPWINFSRRASSLLIR